MTNQTMPLSMAKAGEVVTIVGNRGGCGLQKKLADMGLTQGIQIRVLNSQITGPVLIDIRGSRIALGRGVAQKIMVTPVKSEMKITDE